MADQNINITPIEGIGINVPTEIYNIDIRDENIVIEKKVEENTILIQETPDIDLELKKEPDYVLNLEGEVIKIDANYPQAQEAARIATEKAEEAKEIVEGFDDHAASKITEYDANATDKIAEYNANAVEKTNAFNSNATSKTTAFNDNASSKTADFNNNASTKTTAFDNNATSKTNTFNQNATDKTTAFNNNASEKTTAFNDNYTAKKALIDGQVQLAKDWATKTDGTVDGTDYSAKYYAQSILPYASDITTVAGIASDVTTVSSISTDVTSVASNATDISTVADSISDVNSVGSNIAKVTAVADDLTNIDAVNANKTNIDAVAGNNSNITAVANNATNINAVAGNESNINAVNANKTNIDTVAGINTDVTTVSGISSDVTSVASNNTDISAVADDLTNINSVAGDLTNIDSVAGDIANINAVAGDLTNIDNASSYAQLAKDWANKTNGTVDGSEYSSKYYAEQTASLLSTKQDTLVSGTNIKTINSNSILGSGNLDIDGLPSQTGQSGKFLTTDGSTASWGTVSIPTVNDATLTITQGGTTKGTFTANASSNVTIDLDSGSSYTAGTGIDITNDVISVASPTLTNSSTLSSSVGIFSDFGQYGSSSVGIGYSSVANSSGDVAIGYMSQARDSYATALGYQARAGGYCSIQLGYGSNNTSDKFKVGFFRGTDNQAHNWELLDGTTGLIPDARISSNIARTTDIPAAQVNSDWNAVSGVAQILNKPTLGTMASESASDYTPTSGLSAVATSGSYNDLSNKPTIPTVDQTYDGTSTNAQSGVAVAQALSSVSVSKDNLSITENANNQLQTVGVIDRNNTSTAIKTWTGTKAQYDAIQSKDSNTIYNVTDDVDISLPILEVLYPVGSVYITTANTCPLSTLISGSTWELVSSGRVLQGADSGHGAGTTIEAGLPNIEGFTDWWSYGTGTSNNQMGAFLNAATPLTGNYINMTASGTANYAQLLGFSAQNSNSIYGNSTTVQPPAYFVNIYRRLS